MKKNWLISVKTGSLKKMSSELRKQKIKILQELQMVSILIIEATEDQVGKLRTLPDILAIEPEGSMGIM